MHLGVYNVEGTLVRALVDGVWSSGANEIRWDGRDAGGNAVGSGVYFYRLDTGKTTLVKKMILLR